MASERPPDAPYAIAHGIKPYPIAYIYSLCAIAYPGVQEVTMDIIARDPRQIGDALRRFRTRRGWSQEELGDRAGLRQATISTVENGNPEARLRTLAEMLAALDLELVIRARSKVAPADIGDLF